MILKNDFLKKIKELLPAEEFDEFKKLSQSSSFKGLRVNTLKCDIDYLKKFYDLKETPFNKECFYVNNEIKGIGNNPLHHAGAFYMQEPSANSAVTVLAPKPYDKVLDLCAAPGGKSTQIAQALRGKGILWSNEYIRQRAQILLSNIERMGIRNAVVSSCHPDILCQKLCGFFDKVLVDAPCSGEGMFRKDPDAINYWSLEHVKACAERQKSILNSAAKAVKNGGIIVYSTCTFSQEENEAVIESFLKENDNFILEDTAVTFGRPGQSKAYLYDMSKTRRIFPMDGGEGHFIAKLRCIKQEEKNIDEHKINIKRAVFDEAKSLFSTLFNIEPYGMFDCISDKVVLLPKQLPNLSGLGVIRAGVLFGEIKKSRIEPCHALFMAANKNELNQYVDLGLDSIELQAFLRGEEICVSEDLKGYTAVMADSITTGFGKCSNGVLKNRYPKGLRIR